MPLRVRVLGALVGAVLALAVLAPGAAAVILAPTTIDGPSSAVVEFGGIAMAPDGTGGLVYTKVVEGTPHVFACRYDGSGWAAPVRVDAEGRYEATEPRIAADRKGRLLVVWVTPVATVHGKVQKGLMAASLGPGAEEFSAATVVDPNVGEGVGVDPAVAGVSSGQATVAYRVVTNNFSTESIAGQTAVRLHPGDVLADIRVARLAGERWSRLGAINRNPAASMRPPTPTNGPQVRIGATGNAVVGWQEPDQTGAARIWVRRVFAAGMGPPLQAGPTTWEGRPVTGEADAFSLGVTQFDQARVVVRVDGEPGPSSRLYLSTLQPNYKPGGAALVGPASVPTAGVATPGAPAVAAGGVGGGEGRLRIAFAGSGSIQLLGGDGHEGLAALASTSSPSPSPEAAVVATVGGEGGGVTAYEASGPEGLPVVGVRQEFPDGEAQGGYLSGAAAGPISELAAGSTEAGDALIGFRQGEPGAYEIVADRISAPPATFSLQLPKRWVTPRGALLRWRPAPSSVGGIFYTVLVDGRPVGRRIAGREFRPRPALLGDGVRQVKVIATDSFGGQVISEPAKLRVDAEPPRAQARVRGLAVRVLVTDSQSGVARATCSFGDGSARVKTRRACHHTYARPGRYAIVVRERDRAGNAIVRHLEVGVR